MVPQLSNAQEPRYNVAVYEIPQPNPYSQVSSRDVSIQQLDVVAGKKAAKISLVCGIIGMLILPIVFSVIAIIWSDKAERLGYVGRSVNAGRVLGAIGLMLAALSFFTSALMLVSQYT